MSSQASERVLWVKVQVVVAEIRCHCRSLLNMQFQLLFQHTHTHTFAYIYLFYASSIALEEAEGAWHPERAREVGIK